MVTCPRLSENGFFSSQKDFFPRQVISFRMCVAQCPLNTPLVGRTLAAGPWSYSADYGFWMESLCLIVIECPWAQPLATLSCCGPLKHTLLPGSEWLPRSPCSATGWCCSRPRPQVTNCYWGDQLSMVTDCQWAAVSGDSSNRWWSGGCHMESEVRGESQPPPQDPPSSPCPGSLGPDWVARGPREQSGGCVHGSPEPSPGLAWPRPWGVGEPLPHPCLWDLTQLPSA